MPSSPKFISGLVYSKGKLVRAEQRPWDALRPIEVLPNFISSAEGSALIRLGQTQVICTASVEEGVPLFLKGSGKGWISSEYAMIPRATDTRTPREVNRGRQSGRTMEIQRLVGRSLRAIADLPKLGERTIWIDCDVIRADGGTRTASITGSMVALALACKRLQETEVVKRMPLNDYVAAISVGMISGEVLLDLDYSEDSNAEVDMNVVMTGSGRFVEVQASAEGRPFGSEELARMIDLTRPAIQQLINVQKSVTKIELPGAVA